MKFWKRKTRVVKVDAKRMTQDELTQAFGTLDEDSPVLRGLREVSRQLEETILEEAFDAKTDEERSRMLARAEGVRELLATITHLRECAELEWRKLVKAADGPKKR